MAVPDTLYKINFNMQIGAGDEIAVWGHHVTWDSTIDSDAAASLAKHCRDAWQDSFTATGLFPTSVTGANVTAYSLNPAAPYHARAKGVSAFGTDGDPGWTGGGGGDSLPWECALVVTLNAFENPFDLLKARKRGRMYLGPVAKARISGGGGLMSSDDAEAFANSTLAYFEAVNDLLAGTQVRAVVFSRGGKGGAAAAGVSNLVNISCDNKVDSQRRRENKQDASVVRFTSANLDA